MRKRTEKPLTDKQSREIRIRLLEKGWSQTDLAEKIGISKQYLSRLLNGIEVNPERVEQIDALLNYKIKRGK